MAVHVAGILDELAINQEWLERGTATLNEGLSKLTVSPNYNVMITIAGRSYVVASDEKGKLSVTVVPNALNKISKATAKAACRVDIGEKALANWDKAGDDWSTKMQKTRKTLYTGNVPSFNSLQQELAPHIGQLRDSVEATGPGAHVLQRAVEEYNAMLETTTVSVSDGPINAVAEFFPPAKADNPLFDGARMWILFSAPTGFNGNMGQSNYSAGNLQLDAQTFSHRQSRQCFESVSLMWGAVAGLGMRWKAFASQDFLAADQATADYILMTHLDALGGLKQMVTPGIPPEWTTVAKGMQDQCWLIRYPDPWGFAKGKGGGLTFAGDLNFHDLKTDEPEVDVEKTGISPFFPGRRIKIQGLQVQEDMNGTKGTLVEEVQAGVWHVRLDDDVEKLLRTKNMVQIHTSTTVVEEKVAPKASHEQMCLAGTWDDWTPHNMQWDEQLQCHTMDVTLTSAADIATFAISRGQAGERKWKPTVLKNHKKWNMGAVNGCYKIKAFVVDSKIANVEWEPVA